MGSVPGQEDSMCLVATKKVNWNLRAQFLEPLLCNQRSHSYKKPTHRNQRVDHGTREYPFIGRKTSAAKTKETDSNPDQHNRRNPKMLSNTHSTPSPPPSMEFHHFPRRGEVRLDLPSCWIWYIFSGVLSTRITRRKRRAAERQSHLILVALQEGSWGCWGQTGWPFNILAEGWDQVMRRGVGNGWSWVSPVYCIISWFCLQGSSAQ